MSELETRNEFKAIVKCSKYIRQFVTKNISSYMRIQNNLTHLSYSKTIFPSKFRHTSGKYFVIFHSCFIWQLGR